MGEEQIAAFEHERAHLRSVAFRILGSEPDTEDVVQDAWIAYDRARCDDEPEETTLLADELTAAFVVVLDELTPPQRVALVLHDAFGFPFHDIAHILGTSAGSAKKLASRARERVRRRAATSSEDRTDAPQIVQAFLRAAQDGNTDRLVELLDTNVVRTADPHVLPPGAPGRIEGVAAVVAETRLMQANAARAQPALIDGRPGIVVLAGAKIEAVLVVRVERGRIAAYDVVGDPRRLARLDIQT